MVNLTSKAAKFAEIKEDKSYFDKGVEKDDTLEDDEDTEDEDDKDLDESDAMEDFGDE